MPVVIIDNVGHFLRSHLCALEGCGGKPACLSCRSRFYIHTILGGYDRAAELAVLEMTRRGQE